VDITRCINGKCPAKKHCRRYTTKGNIRGEAYFKPSPKGTNCSHFSPPKALFNKDGKCYLPGTEEEVEERKRFCCRQVECDDSADVALYYARCQTCLLSNGDCYKLIIEIAYNDKVFGRLKDHFRELGYSEEWIRACHWRPWMFMYERSGFFFFKHYETREYLKISKR